MQVSIIKNQKMLIRDKMTKWQWHFLFALLFFSGSCSKTKRSPEKRIIGTGTTDSRIIGTGTTDSRQITNQRTCPYDSINVILSFVIFGIFINNSTAKVTNKS